MKDHPEYMWCGTNCKLVDDRGIWGEGVRPEEPGTDDYLKYSPYIHPTVMYRASLFKKVAGYDEGKKTARCEDYELFMRLFGLGYKGYNIQKCLLDYRVDRENYHNRSWKTGFMKVRCVTKDFVVLESSGRKAGSIFSSDGQQICTVQHDREKKERMADL